MKLSELNPGQAAIICDIEEEYLSLKLLEMGFLPGEIIECRFKSPSGDPIAYSVGSCIIAMRKSEAEMIVIK
ncbi:MAG: ferrous iron transport protein A [Bacteroidetes bacterium]|nr:ferrous iron transport protein A [Bacteroidota bacterium]